MTENDEPTINQETHTFAFNVPPNLFERFSNHIKMLKYLNNESKTKNNWILKAVKSKIERDSKEVNIPKDNRITVQLDQDLWQKIQKHILFIKKIKKNSYSHKQWMVDALEEQLSEEENSIRAQVLQEKEIALK